MAGRLTTHVLDTARGCPAAGVKIELFRVTDGNSKLLHTLITNTDGRTDDPVLDEDDFAQGTYELVFHAGDYQKAKNHKGLSFLDTIPVRFVIAEERHYHVPLLLSPYGYSTYRGS